MKVNQASRPKPLAPLMTTTSAPLSPYDEILNGTFASPLPREDKKPTLELSYMPELITTKAGKVPQARLIDRVKLVPELDVRDFRCQAVVDYLVLEIETTDLKGMYDIQAAFEAVIGRTPRIDPVTGYSRGGRRYRLRIHDPNINKLATLINGPSRLILGIKKAWIHEIEVSIDFYPNIGGEVERQMMVGLLTRHYLPPAGMVKDRHTSMRVVKSEGRFGVRSLDQVFASLEDTATPVKRGAFKTEIRVDRTMSVGDYHKGECRAKILEKVTNERKGSDAADLYEEEKRARIEVTLKGTALKNAGITTFQSLQSFRFEELRLKCFEFRLPTLPNLTKDELPSDVASAEREKPLLDIFLRIGICSYHRECIRDNNIAHAANLQTDRTVLGLKTPVIKPRVGTGANGRMLAFDELHTKIHEALRNLTLRVSNKGV